MIWKALVLTNILIFVTAQEEHENSNYICKNGTEITFQHICDGIEDCLDGQDEAEHLCYHIICPSTMFRCYYGACISKVARCDGRVQCIDASDEYNCDRNEISCANNNFQCLSGECIPMNSTCDGISDCIDKSDESVTACEPVPCLKNTYRCKYGGCIDFNTCCDGFQDCVDGSDESDTLCRSLNCSGSDCKELHQDIFCPPITSARITVTCQSTLDNTKGWLPCDKPLPIGTIARYDCKPYYQPANNYHLSNTYSICQADGTWSRRHILKCEPMCGVINPVATPLVVHGWTVTKSSWPWHAALYSLQGGKWTLLCGGSLVSEKVVLTAAHCMWKMTTNTIQVALGKYSREFNETEDFTQIVNVKEIVNQPLYQDVLGNYGSDISILILNKSVEFSSYILPVCIDWNYDNLNEHLTNNNIGMVAGMGITENDTFSDELRITYLPIVSDEKCIIAQSRDFKKYVTYTSFCAGWNNGTGVCNGDSGGGFVLPKSDNKDQWVLKGIVSVSPRRLGTSFCDPNFYTIFTKVGMFTKWIKDVFSKIHFEDSYETKPEDVVL